MKRFIQTRLFTVLMDNIQSHWTTSELQAIIEEFTDQLVVLCNAGTDYVSLYRTLSYAQIQLKTLQAIPEHRNRAKKKWVLRTARKTSIDVRGGRVATAS